MHMASNNYSFNIGIFSSLPKGKCCLLRTVLFTHLKERAEISIQAGVLEWLKHGGRAKYSLGGDLMGTEGARPGACFTRKMLKNCVKELISWVILRGLFHQLFIGNV